MKMKRVISQLNELGLARGQIKENAGFAHSLACSLLLHSKWAVLFYPLFALVGYQIAHSVTLYAGVLAKWDMLYNAICYNEKDKTKGGD